MKTFILILFLPVVCFLSMGGCGGGGTVSSSEGELELTETQLECVCDIAECLIDGEIITSELVAELKESGRFDVIVVEDDSENCTVAAEVVVYDCVEPSPLEPEAPVNGGTGGGNGDDPDEEKPNCNNGLGNGPEGCNPGNSPNNDEPEGNGCGTPGNPCVNS